MKSNAIKVMIFLLATALLCFGTTLTVSATEEPAAIEATDGAVDNGAEEAVEATDEEPADEATSEDGAEGEAADEAADEAPAAE